MKQEQLRDLIRRLADGEVHRDFSRFLTENFSADLGKIATGIKTSLPAGLTTAELTGLIGRQLLKDQQLTATQLTSAYGNFFSRVAITAVEQLPDPPLSLRRVIDAELADKYEIIPLQIIKETLLLATIHPLDSQVRSVLETVSGRKPGEVFLTEPLFAQLYKKFYGRRVPVKLNSQALKLESNSATAGPASGSEVREELEVASPIVEFVDSILTTSLEKNASDVHIEVFEAGLTVKYRLDGVLYTAGEQIPLSSHEQVISRIKILAGLDIAEHRIPQDGRFRAELLSRPVDFRVSILPSIFGETAVIRILDSAAGDFPLESLGMEPAQLKEFSAAINHPHGLVIVTGPTGSGKTTSLYSAIRSIHSQEKKIVTIEDPVEYQLDGVIQVPVNEKKGLSFASGLRAIVRQDPDVIMVGEIRDLETASIAVNAALTGHLVFTTVHANNSVDAMLRLLNLGQDSYQSATSINLILAQRLLRQICTDCNGRGCENCNQTGYRGRTGVFELLQFDDSLRDLLVSAVSPVKIKQYAMDNGMKTLWQSAQTKLKSGLTTDEEIRRVIKHDG